MIAYYLTSMCRESIVLASTLVAFLANNIRFTRTLARLDITVLVYRAFRVAVAGLKCESARKFSKSVEGSLLVFGQISFC